MAGFRAVEAAATQKLSSVCREGTDKTEGEKVK